MISNLWQRELYPAITETLSRLTLNVSKNKLVIMMQYRRPHRDISQVGFYYQEENKLSMQHSYTGLAFPYPDADSRAL